MDVKRDQIRPAEEEEWIAKYRAAVSTIAPPRSLGTELRAIVDRVRKFLSSVVSGFVVKSERDSQRIGRVGSAEPKLKPLPPPVRRIPQPTAQGKKPAEKAGLADVG